MAGTIAVVDYGMGNLHSVRHALEYLGADVVMATTPAQLHESERIVLPGVGAFAECVSNLRASGLVDALEVEVLAHRKPMLGICVGLQVLAREGAEHGTHAGLGWFAGSVLPLDVGDADAKVPHTGWNDIEIRVEHPLFAGLRNDRSFYFTHSYHFVPDQRELVVATCTHGAAITAAVGRDNVFAAQFHPEKSQRNGLRLLENFLSWRP
jgi:imidazole glycerol-phosphate synthase subunit HisH